MFCALRVRPERMKRWARCLPSKPCGAMDWIFWPLGDATAARHLRQQTVAACGSRKRRAQKVGLVRKRH